MPREDDDYSPKALIPRERQSVRAVLHERDRARWLRSQLKVWAGYAAAGLAFPPALLAAWTAFHHLIGGK